ncbi:hypothetical protein BM536_034210 [Streptomyces phaeoluteigriseus]|uniref:Uncharacterized protein n=1 Tax=Streptomyces phaeoluteigriseus TaxID=114686 RepID=A0A1V6MKZ9_9ACTN|nr:hypothetical protein BM536_034210 [Streptomyces phaeoluteigriseus]
MGHFVEAVLDHLHDEASPHSWRGFGGFCDQVAGGARQGRAGASRPDSRNGVDHGPFTSKLIVGAREDITARNWDSLHFEQQY